MYNFDYECYIKYQPMKKIICATDYSDNAITALKYAYKMSEKLNASLLVTHVFNYPTVLGGEFTVHFQDLEEATFKQEQIQLNAFCKKHLGADFDKVRVTMEVIEDNSVVKALVSKADKINAFMIVAGMKGKSALKDFIMGNTTRKLIDKAPCLVLAIPEDTYYKEIKNIVYATDFEINEDIEVIKKLTEIAKVFDAKIKVVHIVTKQDYEGEAQMEYFKKECKKTVCYPKIEFKILFSEDVFNRLRVYLGDVDADMVIMLEREKSSIFNNPFHKDLVKKMEMYGKVPLISFNENNFGMLDFLKFN